MGAIFDVVAIGDLALGELAPDSDSEVILFCSRSASVNRAESQAKKLFDDIAKLVAIGVALRVSPRSWSDRPARALVKSYDSFDLYQIADITEYERYEFGTASSVYGLARAADMLLEAAYNEPLTVEAMDRLLRIKRKDEEQSVSKRHAKRNVKLGVGGLTDIRWLVRLCEMRYYAFEDAPVGSTLVDRIRLLVRTNYLNAAEAQELADSQRWLSDVRSAIALFGFTPNILPENPDKLASLAQIFDFADANAFLARHESIVDSVRAIYNEGIERLRQ